MAEIKYLVMGVRSQTAPVDIREQFAISQADIPFVLNRLITASPAIHEAVLLTTCNRSELFLAIDDTEAGLTAVQQFWVQHCRIPLDIVLSHTFTYLNEDAIGHLFRVASGLDSMIIGESQIMAQVKDAWQIAQRAGTCSYYLERLFNHALSVGKRVRTLTGIESKDTSVSLAAVQFVQHREPGRLQRPVLVIGGGKVAERLLMSLSDVADITLVNRSSERLKQLTDLYPVNGASWEALPGLIPKASLIFVATGAPHVVLDAEDFYAVRQSTWVFDLSLPRNVCTSVETLSQVTLMNLDDLGVEQSISLGQIEAVAERVIAEGYEAFEQWRGSLPVLPTLTRFRNKLEQLRQEQLEQVAYLPAELQPVVDQFSRSLINKILHAPTVHLKHAQHAQPHLEQLFDLTSSTVPIKP